MGVNIQFSQSYYWLNSWIMANVMQLATQDFCDKFIDYRIDPGRRLYDQMVMAARSGVANIAEGSSRHSTSIETELRLLDVARGSFNELQGDIYNFFCVVRRMYGVLAMQTVKPYGKLDLIHHNMVIITCRRLLSTYMFRKINLLHGLKMTILL